MTFPEALATRVHELEAELRSARRRNRELELSRDLWRERWRKDTSLARRMARQTSYYWRKKAVA